MRKVIILAAAAMAATWLFPASTLAGPNSNGTLIVHNAIIYDSDINYCGIAPLDECENAVVETPIDWPIVWKIYAAFPEGSSPRLKAVTFGIEYSDYVYFQGEPCAEFELATDDWPASGSGMALAFLETQTSELVELYYFAGYNYPYGPGLFSVTPHPTQGGDFADDSVPAILDEIMDYGSLGFGQPGYLPCPLPPVPTLEGTWGSLKATYR